jgi:hypothetical protein
MEAVLLSLEVNEPMNSCNVAQIKIRLIIKSSILGHNEIHIADKFSECYDTFYAFSVITN